MSKEHKISILILAVGMVLLTGYWFMPRSTEAPQTETKKVEERILLPRYKKTIYQNIPQVQEYLHDLKKLIAEGKSVLPLERSELDAKAQKVQNLLLKDKEFLSDTKEGNISMHNDMMRILPAIVSSLDAKTEAMCASSQCYQAEKYNFVTNTTTRAIVDVKNNKVLHIERYPNMQPDISLRLTHMAQAIALHAPEVKKELGFSPRKKDITMANVRGTMKESPCENTTHLCVHLLLQTIKKKRHFGQWLT